MNEKTLYHGSTCEFDKVLVSMGKGFKDFGKGFYLSGDRQHAERIAKRNMQIENDRLQRMGLGRPPARAFLYTYSLDLNLIESFNPMIFSSADMEWMDFVLGKRNSSTSAHSHGYVFGDTADDITNICFKAYRQGVYGYPGKEKAKRILIEALETENLPKQYFIGSQHLADKLRFVKKDVLK
jgi:hypothetical protein